MSQTMHFCGVKLLAWKSGGVNFLTNIMSAWGCRGQGVIRPQEAFQREGTPEVFWYQLVGPGTFTRVIDISREEAWHKQTRTKERVLQNRVYRIISRRCQPACGLVQLPSQLPGHVGQPWLSRFWRGFLLWQLNALKLCRLTQIPAPFLILPAAQICADKLGECGQTDLIKVFLDIWEMVSLVTCA